MAGMCDEDYSDEEAEERFPGHRVRAASAKAAHTVENVPDRMQPTRSLLLEGVSEAENALKGAEAELQKINIEREQLSMREMDVDGYRRDAEIRLEAARAGLRVLDREDDPLPEPRRSRA